MVLWYGKLWLNLVTNLQLISKHFFNRIGCLVFSKDGNYLDNHAFLFFYKKTLQTKLKFNLKLKICNKFKLVSAITIVTDIRRNIPTTLLCFSLFLFKELILSLHYTFTIATLGVQLQHFFIQTQKRMSP